MRIDDLPRLSDDDREALDGYVAVEGVPAPQARPQFPPIAVLLAILGACIFFFGVALSRFDDRLAAVEATVGIEPPPEIIEDFR